MESVKTTTSMRLLGEDSTARLVAIDGQIAVYKKIENGDQVEYKFIGLLKEIGLVEEPRRVCKEGEPT